MEIKDQELWQMIQTLSRKQILYSLEYEFGDREYMEIKKKFLLTPGSKLFQNYIKNHVRPKVKDLSTEELKKYYYYRNVTFRRRHNYEI